MKKINKFLSKIFYEKKITIFIVILSFLVAFLAAWAIITFLFESHGLFLCTIAFPNYTNLEAPDYPFA